jgi:hypothetical protein
MQRDGAQPSASADHAPHQQRQSAEHDSAQGVVNGARQLRTFAVVRQ